MAPAPQGLAFASVGGVATPPFVTPHSRVLRGGVAGCSSDCASSKSGARALGVVDGFACSFAAAVTVAGLCAQRKTAGRQVRSHARDVDTWSSRFGLTSRRSVATAPAPQASTQAAKAEFSWERQWYPVYPLSFLEGDGNRGPTELKLLGKELVLWKDGENVWRCTDGICPHRLAPLSKGKVTDEGQLMCRFHGWCFRGSDGACARVPMAVGDEEAEKRLLDSPQTRLGTYPTKTKKGLLFVWPDSASAQLAEATEPFVGEEIAEDADWFMYEAPAGWRVWMEQTWDPSHAPFLHEYALPFFKPEKAAAMEPFKITDLGDEGIQATHGGYMTSNMRLVADRRFAAPCANYSVYQYPDGRQVIFNFYFVPTELGVVRQITSSAFKAAPQGASSGGAGQTAVSNMLPQGRTFLSPREASKAAKEKVIDFFCARSSKLAQVRRGLKNLRIVSGVLGDQDNAVLSFQDKVSLPAALRSSSTNTSQRFGGASEYMLETHADEFVFRFDEWLRARHDGPLGCEHEMLGAYSDAGLMDRWTAHTRYSPDSRAALRMTSGLASSLERRGVPAALATCALFLALGLPGFAALPALAAAAAVSAAGRLRRTAHGFISGLPPTPEEPSRVLWER